MKCSLHQAKRAFTLVELLVIIAIIAIQAALLLPVLAKGRERSKRTACQGNEREMGVGSQLYSDDDAQAALSGTCNFSDNDLNWLYPAYVPNLKTFICPSTDHSVSNDPTPLSDNAYTPADESGISYGERLHGGPSFIPQLQTIAEEAPGYNPGARTGTGSSYQVVGFLDGTNVPQAGGADIRKTQKTIPSYRYQNICIYSIAMSRKRFKTFAFDFRGQAGSFSSILLIADAAGAVSSGGYTSSPNYPNSLDNHGSDGGNVLYCDGHAAWVTQASYPQMWALGTDQPSYSATWFPN